MNDTIWVCGECKRMFPINIGDQPDNEHLDFKKEDYPVTCINTKLTPYVPQSKLSLAVEALKKIEEYLGSVSYGSIVLDHPYDIAKDALKALETEVEGE